MSFYEDEIDLRPYIISLIKGWWKIALIAIIVAGATLIFTILQPRSYQATATVILTRSQLRLSLAEQFPTISDSRDDASRKDAFLTIARSDSIARGIYNLLGEETLINFDTFARLKESVEINSTGDAIQISAKAKTPSLAAEISNTWAQETTRAINLAYSGEQPLSEIQNQIATAEQAYRDAQTNLGSFIQNSRIELLNNQISEVQTVLSTITQNRASLVEYYNNRKLLMNQLKIEAEALKQQLDRGYQSRARDTGIALAILIVNANTFAYEAGAKFDLQITDLSTIRDSETVYQEDLNALIQQADDQIEKAEVDLLTLSQEISRGETSQLGDEIATQLQKLQAQLESETSSLQELTSDRDLAWEAYQALLEKETEIKTASQANVEVAIASQAVPPKDPIPRNTLTKTIIAGALGVFLGTFWILGAEWWKSSELTSTLDNKPAETSDDI